MPTANERRALWFLAIVALSGSVVRLVRVRGHSAGNAAPDAGLAQQLTRIDSARERRKSSKRGNPAPVRPADRTLRPELVDLDRASANEIESLPGIGPALAARIVAHRDSAGAFGSPDRFCLVKGVGPGLMDRLSPRVVFSGVSAEKGACKVTPSRTSKTHVTNRGKPR